MFPAFPPNGLEFVVWACPDTPERCAARARERWVAVTRRRARGSREPAVRPTARKPQPTFVAKAA